MQPQYNSEMLALLLTALSGPLSSKHTTVVHFETLRHIFSPFLSYVSLSTSL